MRIGFIGAGKAGKALGMYFKAHGLSVAGYCSRTEASAQQAATCTETAQYSSAELLCADCDVLFVTTPDGVISDIDREAFALLREGRIGTDKVWLHVSGALPSDEFSELSRAGCAVGSMHPLQSFGDPAVTAGLLDNTYFSLEGTPKAMETMRMILDTCGARYSEIETARKPLYHAGACILSNYLVTLLNSGFTFLRAAGMPEDGLFDAALPLLLGTLENVREKGAANALTGPIARGDMKTVTVHLSAIEKVLPSETDFYRTLGLATVKMIENQRLDCEKAAGLKTILRGCGTNGCEVYSEIISGG